MNPLVYFSAARRTPIGSLRTGPAGDPHSDRRCPQQIADGTPFILIVPSYGGGSAVGAVPIQVIRFSQRSAKPFIPAAASSPPGNTNFGAAYGIAGDIIAKKCQVPFSTALSCSALRKTLKTLDGSNRILATELTRPETGALDYHSLNAMLNLYDAEGRIQFDKDRLAARHYFLQHVNQNTVFFHNLEEKLRYLVEEGYYETQVLAQYEFPFIKQLFPAGLRQNSASRPSSAPSVLHQLYAENLRRQTLSGALPKIGCAWWR